MAVSGPLGGHLVSTRAPSPSSPSASSPRPSDTDLVAIHTLTSLFNSNSPVVSDSKAGNRSSSSVDFRPKGQNSTASYAHPMPSITLPPTLQQNRHGISHTVVTVKLEQCVGGSGNASQSVAPTNPRAHQPTAPVLPNDNMTVFQFDESSSSDSYSYRKCRKSTKKRKLSDEVEKMADDPWEDEEQTADHRNPEVKRHLRYETGY